MSFQYFLHLAYDSLARGCRNESIYERRLIQVPIGLKLLVVVIYIWAVAFLCCVGPRHEEILLFNSPLPLSEVEADVEFD